jgi:hypothetical protein
VKKNKRKEPILPAVPFFPIRESRKPAIVAPVRRSRVSEKAACEMASRKRGEFLGKNLAVIDPRLKIAR